MLHVSLAFCLRKNSLMNISTQPDYFVWVEYQLEDSQVKVFYEDSALYADTDDETDDALNYRAVACDVTSAALNQNVWQKSLALVTKLRNA